MTSQTQSWLPGAEQTTTEQRRFLAFIARFCLVLLFPFSCLNKIFDYQSAMAQAAHGGYRFPRRSRRCYWCSAAPSRLSVHFVSCLGFIVVRRPCCSYSTWRQRQFCFTTFGVSPSTAMRGMRTFGRSLRISGWLAVFSTLPPTQRCNRCAAPSYLDLARLKNERAQIEERRLWTTAVTRARVHCGPMPDQIHARDQRRSRPSR